MPDPKFTDYFLLIPVRVYHIDLEDWDESDDFGTAWARIHYSDLELATWHEGYAKGKLGLSTKESGFDLTIIRTPSTVYYCTLAMKEFERDLNKFMKKINELMPEPPPEEDLEL